jgi:aminopeptidase-like protein
MSNDKLKIGREIYKLCEELWPITRSITGDGVRETLKIINRHLQDLVVNEIPTGTQCFDWDVPLEWNIRSAYIINPNGEKIIDFKNNNLHVVGYSTPINTTMSLKELQNNLFSLRDQPDAIPYVTSYYKKNWGFCISENQRKLLIEGDYKVYIDSELKNGSLTYGELIIPGKSKKEVFLSTYICHPSMANNELSGPSVTTYIAKWLQSMDELKYTYRIIFIPETIGSICYLSKNIKKMKESIVAGFNVSCIGDNNCYSYLPSRNGNTISDVVALHVLNNKYPDFVRYSFLDRGSDERQYCAPGVDLPICSIMRSKYGSYAEYHTSLDNLDFISPEGLFGGFDVLRLSIKCLELNNILKSTILCEPQLGKRSLYPNTSIKSNISEARKILNFLTYADGSISNIDIAEIIGTPLWELDILINRLIKEGLLKVIE